MTSRRGGRGGAVRLSPHARSELLERVRQAVDSVRRHGRPVAVAIVVETDRIYLPLERLASRRRLTDRFFFFSSPGPERCVVSAIGQAVRLVEYAPEATSNAAQRIRLLSTGSHKLGGCSAQRDLVWVGGCSFAQEAMNRDWAFLAPVDFVLPEMMLRHRSGHTTITLAAKVDARTTPESVVVRLGQRIASLQVSERDEALVENVRGMRTGDSIGDLSYDAKVERALAVLSSGGLKKVVVARRVEVEAARNFDVTTVLAAILHLHARCYCFAVGVGRSFFIGASPELLIAKRGNLGESVALAGTAARSSDEVDDVRLARELERDPKRNMEHRYVEEWIRDRLESRFGAAVTSSEKSVMKLEDVQHLERRLHFTLTAPTSALKLAETLHPTPAVSGYPRDEAMRVLRDLDDFARGWYAGSVGWVDGDGDGDGEFCVAIRSALVRGSSATLFAGCGVVQGSTPDLEMQESEKKLMAMLRVLT